MIVTVSHLYPSAIIPGNLGAYPESGFPFGDPSKVDFILACKYDTRVEETDCDKHSSLLQNEIDYDLKRFYSNGPKLSILFKKTF